MHGCSPRISGTQSAEAAWPTQRALDDPTPLAKPFARLYAVARYPNCNPPTVYASAMVC